MLGHKEIQSRINCWLRSRGRFDKDLASEMFLYCLEKQKQDPEFLPNMKIVELRARDNLNPRGGVNEFGQRLPRDALNHTVNNLIELGDGQTEERTNLAVVDFREGIVHQSGLAREKRRLKRKITNAKYLSRLSFGHLPFVL